MTDSGDPSALRVSALVSDTVVRVDPDATLLEVAGTMSGADVGAVVVGATDDAKAVVSERDVVRALAAGRDPATTRAIEVATTTLVWCDVDATVAEVAREMLDRYVRHVLVEDDGRLVAVVSARDLLGVYAASGPDADDGEW
jgi:CBS domain-containing protein